MQDNTIPADADGWNSDEIVLGDLSCKQTAQLLTGFTATLRLVLKINAQGGSLAVLKLAQTLVSMQIKLIEGGPKLDGDNQKELDEHIKLGLVALGAGLSCGLTKITPMDLASIITHAMIGANDLAQKTSPEEFDKTHLNILVKKNGETRVDGSTPCLIGISQMPVDSMIETMAKANPEIIKLNPENN